MGRRGSVERRQHAGDDAEAYPGQRHQPERRWPRNGRSRSGRSAASAWQPFRRGLVPGFGGIRLAEIEAGVAVLGEVLEREPRR